MQKSLNLLTQLNKHVVLTAAPAHAVSIVESRRLLVHSLVSYDTLIAVRFST